MRNTNQWILQHFGLLFSRGAFLLLCLLGIVYFSPFAKVRIGGKDAQPLVSKWRWFSIALCTTVATGILFWGTAEPLYHLHQPPAGLALTPNSPEAAQFAMSTMFLHWSFTPYAIYAATGLVFAYAYYNLKQPFSIRSLLYPLLGNIIHGPLGTVLDIICLSALTLGMATTLGTGIFALMGGLEITTGIKQSDIILGIIGFVIVTTFILSAISGLKNGITFLSNWNTRAFLVLIILIFLLGPTAYILEIGMLGFGEYIYSFLPRSTSIQSGINKDWLNNWTVFYFANWFAWAPVTSLFLGRLGLGYTVRDFINYNLLFPALFSCFWMIIFSGISMEIDLSSQGSLYEILTTRGEENVMFSILSILPFGTGISILTLLMIFISYVTAADSNVSAMSAISTIGINPEKPEAPIWIKAIWGSSIGLIAWIMITSAGMEGIRLMAVLSGFPALLIIMIASSGIVKILLQRKN